MSNYLKLAVEAGDQYLSLLAEGQDQYLKAVGTSASWMAAVPAAPSFPAVPGFEVPTPKDMAEAGFAFATKFMKQQKTFTEKLFAAMTPEKG